MRAPMRRIVGQWDPTVRLALARSRPSAVVSAWGPWVPVDAGATFAPSNVQRALLIDAGVPPGDDQVQIEIPPAPVDGQILLLNDYLSRSAVNPILLVPPGGGVGVAIIGAPGTFDDVGPVVMSLPGGTSMGLSVGFQFFARDKRWIQWL